MDITLASIGERLRKYLKYKGFGVNEFGSVIGTSGAQVSNILKGKNYGLSKLINIIEHCQDIDLDWLLKGEGEMILNKNNKTSRGNDTLVEENESLKKEKDIFKSKIENFEGVNAYKDMTIEAYKTTIEVLLSSNKDLKEYLNHLKASKGRVDSRKTA